MTRVRRARWIAIAAVAATAVGTLVVGAQAYADRDGSRCARPPQATTVVKHDQHESWRSGALRAMGCRAWRHVHHPRRSFVRLGR